MDQKTYSLPTGQSTLDPDKLERIRKAFEGMADRVRQDPDIQAQIRSTIDTVQGINEYHRNKPTVLGRAVRTVDAGEDRQAATAQDD